MILPYIAILFANLQFTTKLIILNKRTVLAISIFVVVLILDQWLKFWVKTNMTIGDMFPIFSGSKKGYIHFIENPGMAFGLELGGRWGKILLTLLRIIFIFALGGALRYLILKKAPMMFIGAISLILVGAVGNIVDSVFYGVIFTESYHSLATFMPEDGGYAPLLQGKVVDMFYFPLIRSEYPSWFPYFGGQPFEFFRPIFNIADASISIGVMSIFLFMRKTFNQYAKLDKEETSEQKEVSTPTA